MSAQPRISPASHQAGSERRLTPLPATTTPQQRGRAVLHSQAPATPSGDSTFVDSQRCVNDDLPDPEMLIRNLARSVFEALAGVREVEQVARWVSPDTFSHLLRRAQHAARARRLRDRPVKRPHITVRSCLWQSPRAGVVEATTIVDLGVRARAVAIRLEVYRGRWRAESISIL